MKKSILYILLVLSFPAGLLGQITVSGSSGANGTYTSFTNLGGAFAAINGSVQTGNSIVITINGSSTSESGTNSLNAGTWSSVNIYPTGSGYTISGSVAGAIINLNGANNVTIDGSVNASGVAKDLSIINFNNGNTAGTSTIRFINDATNNLIKFCNLKGSSTAVASGIVFFSTSVSGITGNDHNTIDNNNITSCSDATRPVNAIFSLGTLNKENNDIIIQNNWIFDFLSKGTTSAGIYLSSYTTSCTISGNSFFETTSFSPTASGSYSIIQIVNAAGNGFIVSGNYIGGSSYLCGGSSWTKNNTFNNIFVGINLSVGSTTAIEIQNNSIQNIIWANSLAATWTGISISGGAANIGTSTGNNIGAPTGTGSISVTGGSTGLNVIGVNLAGTGTVDCQNNNIGSIIAANNLATFASNFYGINKTATAGITIIQNNTIGSTTTPNSINSTSTSSGNPQTVFGIFNSGTGNITISGNTISNLKNSSTNITTTTRGRIAGILSSNGLNLISNNLIYNLNISNANGASNETASACGIGLSGAALQRTITGNTIYNITNSYPTFTGYIIGLYFTGNSGVNKVSENFIHSLSAAIGSTLSNICGMRIASGSATYSNNIISLGGNTAATIFGIYETGTAGNTDNFYFNTVYISGAPLSGANRSYALYSSSNANARVYRNNLFINARSTSGRINLHYAFNISVAGGSIICDNNDYFVSGTAGILGCYGTNKTTIPIVTGQDVGSFALNPVFANPGGIIATDYRIGTDLIGTSGTGITTDYSSVIRNNPTIGAWERPVNKWMGNISNDWNTPGNWTGNALPVGTNPNIIFDAAPVNHLYLDKDRIVNNITNDQSPYRMVTNGHKLTLKGALNFTGGAQIDASAIGSAIEFSGVAPQSIPTGSFYNDFVYNLIINNSNNVILNGSLSLLNSFTVTSGLLDAFSATPTFIYAGTSAQSIETARFLNDKVYNLTIDNVTGVTLNTNFTIDNSMTINSGKLFTIPVLNELKVLGTITNNAGSSGFVIKSDATGEGKLFNNSSSAPATVELYLSGGLISPTIGIFHYFVPPVVSMSIGSTPTIAEVKTALGLTNFNGSLLRYNEPQATTSINKGWQYFDNYPGVPPGFTSLQSSEAYNIYLNGSSDVLKFKGSLNAGEHTFNLSYTPGNKGAGWNLVGNPYPCNYDLNGINGLGTVVDGISNTVYYNNNGGYGYWNVYTKSGSSLSYTDILPPMTGFYVLLTNASFNQLVLPVSSKTTINGDTRLQHKSLQNSVIKEPSFQKIKLVLTNGSKSDETLVLLSDDATSSFNEHFDAFKLFNPDSLSPYIYSEVDGVDYFMKALAGLETAPVIVPLKLIVREAGIYTIKIPEFENLENVRVVLKHGPVETSLKRNSTYTFNSVSGTFADFKLIIGGADSQRDELIIKNEDIRAWYSNNYIYLHATEGIPEGRASLTVTDFNGRQIFNNLNLSINPSQTSQIYINLSTGFYIADIKINNIHYKSKIIVY